MVVVVDDSLGGGSELGETSEQGSEGGFGAGRHDRAAAVAAEEQSDADRSTVVGCGHWTAPSDGVSAMGRRGCWRWRVPSWRGPRSAATGNGPVPGESTVSKSASGTRRAKPRALGGLDRARA